MKVAVLRQTKKLLNIQQSGEEKFSLRCKRVGDVLRSVAKPTPELRSVAKPLAKLRGVAKFIPHPFKTCLILTYSLVHIFFVLGACFSPFILTTLK